MVAVGSGTNNSIAYSTDGMAWTGLGKDVFSSVGNGVGYNPNGNQWVAVGSGTNSIAYSDNILTWTGLGTSIFTSRGNKVESNGSRWVAVGQGTNSIAYSNNGIAWTGLGTSIFSTAGYGVAWSGTQWVAVGQGTNSIAYSSNGITWTGIGTSIFSTAGRNVAWTGSRWVAVGEGTYRIAYSSDGIAWTLVTSSSSIFSTAGFGVQFPLTVSHIRRKFGESSVFSLSSFITSTSPGAITYNISSGSNLATFYGATMNFTGVGTVVVVATQAATDMYAAASKTIVISIGEPLSDFSIGNRSLASGEFVIPKPTTTLTPAYSSRYQITEGDSQSYIFGIATSADASVTVVGYMQAQLNSTYAGMAGIKSGYYYTDPETNYSETGTTTYGTSPTISADGNIFAVYNHSGTTSTTQKAYIYRRSPRATIGVINTIGSVNNSFYNNICLSGNGKILATYSTQQIWNGAWYNSSFISVYKYVSDNNWTHIYQSAGQYNTTYSGIAISFDGTVIAVRHGTSTIQMFKYKQPSYPAYETGADLYIPEFSTTGGKHIAMSMDGSTIAVGGTKNYGGRRVLIYRINTSVTKMTSIGIIDSPYSSFNGDGFGTCISLSATGNIIAIASDAYNQPNGAALVYGYSSNKWNQIADLSYQTGQQLGTLVAISADGCRIVVAPQSWTFKKIRLFSILPSAFYIPSGIFQYYSSTYYSPPQTVSVNGLFGTPMITANSTTITAGVKSDSGTTYYITSSFNINA
jgi:hypothetical protein